METLLFICDIYSIKQGSELPCKCRTTEINRWENLKHRFYHFTLSVSQPTPHTPFLRTWIENVPPLWISIIHPQSRNLDYIHSSLQRETRTRRISECVTVCVWTEGWCRVGLIVTMALFLVTTQRNNKQLSSPPPPPPPVYLRLRTHGRTKTEYPARYLHSSNRVVKWNAVILLLAVCRVDSEVCASDNKQLQWNRCRMSKYHFSTTLEINGPIL